MPKCKYCDLPITWGKTPDGKNTPINMDGSPHDCRTLKAGGVGEHSVSKYPTASQQKSQDDMDRQKMIVWQNMMSHATQLRGMIGNFPDDPDKMAKQTVFICEVLWEQMWRKMRGEVLVDMVNSWK